jgi:hypothetical protein
VHAYVHSAKGEKNPNNRCENGHQPISTKPEANDGRSGYGGMPTWKAVAMGSSEEHLDMGEGKVWAPFSD